MGKVNEFKKGKAIVVVEENGNRIVADYIYSYIYGGTPFINGTPYLNDELIYCSGFINSKCFQLFSRLKRVVNGRHWRKNRRTKIYIHFKSYYKCYPL